MRKADHVLFIGIESILAPFGARKLSFRELKSYQSGKYIAGWEVNTQLVHDGAEVLLRLLFDSLPNQSLPSVVFSTPNFDPLSFPHLESNGKLCVWPSRYIVDLNNTSYISTLLSDAVKLLDKALTGKIDSHFEDEFLSYWFYHSQLGSCDISLLNPDNEISRSICLYRISTDKYVFGDSNYKIVDWLDNQHRLPNEEKKNQKLRSRSIARIECSAIIFFDKAIHPSQYPKSAGQFYDLISREFPSDSRAILELVANTLSCKSISRPELLISFKTEKGQALVGLRFDRNLFCREVRKSLIDGFRTRVPLKVIMKRTMTMKVFGRLIYRLDPSWVIGRDSNPDRATIAENTVAIIGCGSIGSSVVRLLVKSGVSQLILIDGEILQTENLGRHELGYDYHGQNKALALKKKLCKE